MLNDREHQRAIMEGERCDAAEQWDRGMPFKTEGERRMFERGFESGWDRAALQSARSPERGEVAAQPSDDIVATLTKALRNLTIHARTTGGTAGPDAGLMAACDEAESALLHAPQSVSPPPTAPTTGEAVFRNALELIRDWPLRDSKMESAQMRKLAHDTLNALATPTPASASTWAVREFDIEQIVDVAMFGDRGNRIDLFNRINEILKGRSL